jgi:hypothetical protein
MPDFPVELSNPDESLVVTLNKLPSRGAWFALADGTPVQAKVISMIGGEPVIFAVRGTQADKARLRHRKRQTRRDRSDL